MRNLVDVDEYLDEIRRHSRLFLSQPTFEGHVEGFVRADFIAEELIARSFE